MGHLKYSEFLGRDKKKLYLSIEKRRDKCF